MEYKSVKICQWNAQGLCNLATIKQIELFVLKENIDILFLVETYLKPHHKFFIHGYSVYRNDRLNSSKGGVAIAIKNSIHHELIAPIDTVSIENICVSSKLNGKTVSFICAYCPKFSSHFKSDIKKLSHSKNEFFIFGDFNARNTAWSCSSNNQAGKILFDLQLQSNFFIYHPNTPTHYPHSGSTPSCLDILLSNSTFHISDLIAFDNNQLNSDHTPVICSIDAKSINVSIKCDDFKGANWNLFCKIINNNIDLNSDFNSSNCTPASIDSSINKLTNTILSAKCSSIPLTIRQSVQFQLSDTTKMCISNRNSIKRKWQRSTDPTEKIMLKSLLKLNNQLIRNNVFQDRNSNWSKTLSNLGTGCNKFWQIKKRIMNKASYNIFKILDNNNVPVYSNSDKANCVADAFKLAHELTQNDSFSHSIDRKVEKYIQRLNISNLDECSFQIIRPEEIYQIIKKFKSFKAPGFDGIQNIILKHLPRKAIILLTKIFNGCLKIGYFPENFKCAKIVPVLKPNKSPIEAKSYRPISLLSCLGKTLEKIILNRLVSFIEQHDSIINEQFGFRSGHSTIHQVSRITKFISINKQQRKSTGLVLLDVEKAFDTVWHDALLFKLNSFGFPTSSIKIIQSFLSNRTFKVFINGSTSNLNNITAGVPQGSILSPTLYSLFISDFKINKNCNFALYADDTAIFTSSKQIRGVTSKLQLGLNSCLKYFNKWKIKINTDKTQAIYFPFNNSRRNIPRNNLLFNNTQIHFSNNVKYLGVHLDKKLNFSHHIKSVCEKAIICSRSLYPFLARKSKLSTKNKMILYTQVIRSIITYGCPIWCKAAKTHLKKLQIIQNKNLKIINDLPMRFNTISLHENLNFSTIAQFIDQFCCSFYEKCIQSPYTLISEITP